MVSLHSSPTGTTTPQSATFSTMLTSSLTSREGLWGWRHRLIQGWTIMVLLRRASIYNRRFLYVTFHPWPLLAATQQAASPNLPPLCSGLDCAVIDLATFETVGRLDNAQKGLLSNKATAESVLPSISRKVTFVPKLETHCRL